MTKTIKVLFVEDDKLAKRIIQLLLTDIPCQFKIVETSCDALALLKKQSYDLLMTDIEIKPPNGLEMAKLIRQHPGKNQNIPIVAMTAHCKNTIGPQAAKAGIDEIVQKPLTVEICQTLFKKYGQTSKKRKI